MNIEQMIDGIIKREGGYVDHPADRGGPTNWGITEKVARASGYQGDMRTFHESIARGIYRRQYWTAPSFDQVAPLSSALAEELLDTGVNMGPGVAGQYLQRALNVLNQEAKLFP
ncbi:MAG: glycosyl hydrolase 108 family protein, partial [Rhodoglobus sp.]|nr:glycosyl hydrolase 108 family protein [Rhodoglobus sp.]